MFEMDVLVHSVFEEFRYTTDFRERVVSVRNLLLQLMWQLLFQFLYQGCSARVERATKRSDKWVSYTSKSSVNRLCTRSTERQIPTQLPFLSLSLILGLTPKLVGWSDEIFLMSQTLYTLSHTFPCYICVYHAHYITLHEQKKKVE
jgi:hypothetical protein